MNFTTRIITIILTGLCCNIAAVSADDKKYQCPDIPLLKEAPIELRKLSTNPLDEPFYLSEQFCFGLSGPKIQLPKSKLFSKYDKPQATKLYINYNRVYEAITDRTQKLNFVHLFLRELSHQAIVLPSSYGEPLAQITFEVMHKNNDFASHLLKITPDMGHVEALHQLREMQNNPPKAEAHPEIMKLIEFVLDVTKIVHNEEIYPLIDKFN